MRRSVGSDPARLILPALLLALVMPVILMLAILVPLGEVPDEVFHAVRTDSLTHGSVLGQRQARPDGRVPFDAGVIGDGAVGDAAAALGFGLPIERKKVTPAVLAGSAAFRWGAPLQFNIAPNTAIYMPVFYAPGSAGMAAAKALGFGPSGAIRAARLVNAMCFVALGLAALLVARRGQLVIFAALALPMTMLLAASLNQDGLLIATAALAAAALTRDGADRRWARPLAGVALAAVIAVKPAYAPLALAMLAALPWRGLLRRDALPALAASVAVLLPAIAWVVVITLYVSVPFVRGPAYLPGPLWPGDPATVFQATDLRAQLTVLLHRPSLVLMLPAETLLQDWRRYMHEVIGIFGTLDLTLPGRIYTAWKVALLAAVVATLLQAPTAARPVGGLGAAAIGVGVAAAALALFVLQYLTWTLVGAAEVDGVQGRYFIPLLPFIGIALPALGSRAAAPFRQAASIPVGLAAFAGLLTLPTLIVATYYLR